MRLEWCVLLLLFGVKPTKLTTTPKPSKRLPLQERHTNAFQERHASSHRTRHASSLLDRHVEYQSMYPEIKRLQAQTDDTEKLLHSEIQDFKFQLHELKESFNKQLHAQEQYFKLKLHGQEENFKRMLRRKTKGIHRKTEKLSTKGRIVAFHAYPTSSLTNLRRNQNIVMETVGTNVGRGYDSKTGEFRCPTSGYYVFMVTFLVGPKHMFSAKLVKNGKDIGYLSEHGSDPYSSVSSTVIVKLVTGDRVWLRTDRDTHDSHAVIYNMDTTFSGFRIS